MSATARPHAPLPVRAASRPVIGRTFAGVVIATSAVLLLGLGFGPNLNLAALSLLILSAGCIVLWRPGEAPVLVLLFVLHWLSAAVAIFHANWLDQDIVRYSSFGGDMSLATILSLVGLMALALGMRVGAGRWRVNEAETARSIALAHPVVRWFGLYCAACAVSFVALGLMWLAPGLAQVLLAVAALRWAFFFVLAYASFVRGVFAGPYLPIAFGVELAIGLGTYFSDFRIVFMFAIFAALASGLRMTLRMQAGLAVLVAALLGLGIVWTGVKEDYRHFVADGRKEQVVAIDYATRMAKLGELAGALDARSVDAGFDRLLRRLSYVEYFSIVLGFVPDHIDHEYGALMLDALTRPFFPRALFPEKTAINDTERTNYYTAGSAGESEGTSISIGYVGEAYIDFGAYGMMVALFGIGWGYGLIYRLLLRAKRAGPLVGMGLAAAALQSAGQLETSFTKAAGGIAVSVLAVWLVVRFVLPLAAQWVAVPGAVRPGR